MRNSAMVQQGLAVDHTNRQAGAREMGRRRRAHDGGQRKGPARIEFVICSAGTPQVPSKPFLPDFVMGR